MYIGKEPIVGNFQVCDAISVVNGQAAYTMQVSSGKAKLKAGEALTDAEIEALFGA